jgi:adenosylcobinamide-phosphate synthase
LIFPPLSFGFGRTLAVLVAEAVIGYPDALHRVLPHPVTWAGRAIVFAERRLNVLAWTARRRLGFGILTVVVIAGAAGALGLLLDILLLPYGFLVTVLIGTVGLAQRSLYVHVAAVRDALEAGNLVASRKAVGMIVGRDVDGMEAPEIAAAALESLAESFCDGVVAPAVFLLAGGLGGLFFYKAVNTADSIIGHREPRWRAFGWAAARLDDVLNFLPARLSGVFLAAAGRGGWQIMLRDARKHESPNAGWPEAAMAGAMGVKLGGPVRYEGVVAERAWFGEGAAPGAADIRRGLKIYTRGCLLLWFVLAAGAIAWQR